jgi:uncharacterized protein YbjT (DUF2867 family)
MILITGASGRVGRRTAELLASEGHRLRLMTRDPQRAPQLPGAAIVRGDFAEPDTLQQAFAGISVALLVSGSGAPGQRALLHRNAFQAAQRAHVGHVIYFSLEGAAPDSKYPYSRDHYQSEQFLFETGLPCTILRNAFYMDMFPEKFDTAGVIRGPASNGRGAFVSREDVARTSAAILLNPPGGIHDVTGPEALTVAEVAARLSKMFRRQLRYEEAPREAMPDELSAGWFAAIAAGELSHTSDTIQRFTGKAPLTLEEYFKTL